MKQFIDFCLLPVSSFLITKNQYFGGVFNFTYMNFYNSHYVLGLQFDGYFYFWITKYVYLIRAYSNLVLILNWDTM